MSTRSVVLHTDKYNPEIVMKRSNLNILSINIYFIEMYVDLEICLQLLSAL